VKVVILTRLKTVGYFRFYSNRPSRTPELLAAFAATVNRGFAAAGGRGFPSLCLGSR